MRVVKNRLQRAVIETIVSNTAAKQLFTLNQLNFVFYNLIVFSSNCDHLFLDVSLYLF